MQFQEEMGEITNRLQIVDDLGKNVRDLAKNVDKLHAELCSIQQKPDVVLLAHSPYLPVQKA